MTADLISTTAAKAALRRKKVHERSLEQTTAQIAQVEQQIYSIEAANINQETLNAMKNAGNAMKQIHGGLTIDKVDATMYVPLHTFRARSAKPLKLDRKLTIHAGTNYVNSMHLAKRSPAQSLTRRSANPSTKMN